jgi:hypothetical protein
MMSDLTKRAMNMQKAVLAAIAIAFALSGFAVMADPMPEQGKPWHPPANGVVRDQRAAITIAYAIWKSMNPDTDATIGNEAAWQSMMKATLHDGIWDVLEKKNEGIVIRIAQRDARIVDIYVVQ